MGTGSFLRVKYGWGVLLTTHPLLVAWSWKSRAIPLPALWATTGPVTGTLRVSSDGTEATRLGHCVLRRTLNFVTKCDLLFDVLCKW